MKTIYKKLLIVIISLSVFALVTGNLQKVDDWLAIKHQNKTLVTFNTPISTFNFGK